MAFRTHPAGHRRRGALRPGDTLAGLWGQPEHALVEVEKGWWRRFRRGLERPAATSGVRLLPNKDAFLQARDRELLFAETAHRKKVFRTLGGPGVVLQHAVPIATWRGSAKGRRYDVIVEPFATVTKAARSLVEEESELVAHVRGHEQVTVAWA